MTKNYMLRVRLTPNEKELLEKLISHYKRLDGVLYTKSRVFSKLIRDELIRLGINPDDSFSKNNKVKED